MLRAAAPAAVSAAVERCEACDPDATPPPHQTPIPWPTHELTRVLLTLLDASSCHGSLLEGRASDGEFWPLPAPWRAYLLALPLSAVHEAERRGLQHSNFSGMPADLSDLCTCVRTASRAAGRVDGDDGDAPSSAASRGVTASKAEQVRRLLETAAARLPLHAIRRVVDVGAGKGHLTAGLAALVGAPALAVDSDASLLRVGARLYPSVAFSCEAVGDAASLAAQLRAGDLVVGLHPCGALGEALVAACAAHGGVHCLFVPCCHHKQGVTARAPLSRRTRRRRRGAAGGRAEEGVDGARRLAVGGVAADAPRCARCCCAAA